MSERVNKSTDQIVIFTLDELFYALPMQSVVKVIESEEIHPLSQTPDLISGIINYKGRVIPVGDIRKRFGLPEHEIGPDDRIIIADTGKREVAIVVDSVTGITDLKQGQLEVSGTGPPLSEHITGVAKVKDDLVLIYDLDRFLSSDQEKQLDIALKKESE
jgi:purine-binding chemotaxis protein CheW